MQKLGCYNDAATVFWQSDVEELGQGSMQVLLLLHICVCQKVFCCIILLHHPIVASSINSMMQQFHAIEDLLADADVQQQDLQMPLHQLHKAPRSVPRHAPKLPDPS